MEFAIEFTPSASAELEATRVFDRRRIATAIDAQLAHEPNIETKNRKRLMGAAPSFEHIPPIWELRVGEYRVFYDVNEADQTVFVRAVREKPPYATTESIL